MDDHIGFDFGTTNSLISTINGDAPIHHLDEMDRPIPSVVCYEGAQTILGRRAKERLGQAGLGVQGNIVRSPKMLLGQDSVFVEGVLRSPVDIVADVVGHVIEVAQSGGRLPDDVSGAVVTIPVDMQGHRRRQLRQAFDGAGLRIVQFVHEPLAALYGLFRRDDPAAMLRRYDGKLVLVFDWGGGTLDLTLCRAQGDMVVQLMNDGTDEVGGDVFDDTVMNALVKKVAQARGLTEVPIQPGAKPRLLDQCERAKIALSARSSFEIHVGSFFRAQDDDDFDYSLDQVELEETVKPLLDRGLQRIGRLLDKAGFAPEQVALCVATGGMSNMPSVRRRLHELFGPERVRIPDDTATLVAEGAAWIAVDEAGLQLAKNVELALARNSYLPLVKAGTSMPREGEVRDVGAVHLYCTDPRDGLAKFQICAPTRAGKVLANEPRTCLENLTIQVDQKARALRERLELDVSIDDDLILEARARSMIERSEDRCEIHNLEFGLRFASDGTSPRPTERGTADGPARRKDVRPMLGSLSIRANVADRGDVTLVPGELLYQYDPRYFDPQNHPPKVQDEEKLYYQPCSICGRRSNDPLCRCATQPGPGTSLRQVPPQ